MLIISFRNCLVALITIAGLGLAISAQAKADRYVGYYYPMPSSTEAYCARVDHMPEVDKRRRIGFSIGIKSGMSKKSYPPQFTMFAKGGRSHKMIIVSKQDGYLTSIYRVRALLADLTTNARTTPVFEKSGAPENLTFLDLAVLLGFESITVSDGDKFTHQVTLKQQSALECNKDNTTD